MRRLKKKEIKILISAGIVLLMAIAPFVDRYYHKIFPTEPVLEVSFLDVGQGDATLIETPYGQNVLIDGGPGFEVISRLGEELPWWDRQIDLMILTHPHDDHVAGLVPVLERYDVEKILYTGVIHNSPNFLEWLKVIKEQGTPLMIIDKPQTIQLGVDLKIEVLYPFESLSGKEVENLNNSSIVMKLIYKNTSFLITGDAEAEVEELLLASGVDLSADIYKAGHHGSDTSNTEDFIKAINPKTAVIPVGVDNKFGHPSLRTLRTFERLGVEVFRTDEDGTVKLVSDGESMKQ